ncbi:MAG: phosphohydrolase, partial [Chloroflexota bacterium]
DRLDAIGALGIARTFAYGGHKGRELYNPDIPPHLHDDFAAYSGSSAPTINHFYEKLLLLKDRMNTTYAKEVAASRQRFMEQFLEHFFEEWNGDDRDR